jgi:hypothetical protein
MGELKHWMSEIFVSVERPGVFVPDAGDSAGLPEGDADFMDPQHVEAMDLNIQVAPQAVALTAVGSNFGNFSFEDLQFQYVNEMASQMATSDLGAYDALTSASYASMPAIPVTYNFGGTLDPQSQPSHGMPQAHSVFDDSTYTSPVSSSAPTITPGNMFAHPSAMLRSNKPPSADDVGDLDFNMTFTQ